MKNARVDVMLQGYGARLSLGLAKPLAIREQGARWGNVCFRHQACLLATPRGLDLFQIASQIEQN